MKRKLQTIIGSSFASLTVFSALAQDSTNPKTDRPEYSRDRTSHAGRADRLNGAAKASDLIGMNVKNYQDEKLGQVEDLAVDVESGRVVQVIVSTGGFLGIGDTLTAVPPGALHHDVAQKILHLDANKEKLKAAPRFETAKWSECCDSNHLSAVYGYYGQEKTFKFIGKGEAGRNDQGKLEARGTIDSQPNTDAQRATDGKRTTDGQRTADGRPTTDGAPYTVSAGGSDAAWEKNRLSRESQSMIPTERLGQIQKASKLMGTTVQNLQDEKIGTVDNLLVDMTSGRILAVIVSSGGFLGMNDELSAVPPTALRFAANRESLQLDATKDSLSRAPHFQSGQWPDFNQSTYADGMYRAYKVEPYFSTNAMTGADNTARNVRDRQDRTLTPFDQGSSKADVDTTAQIRQEIIAGKNMSVNAKNVKIITSNGRVTLRGPVNSAEEKRLIGEIANRIALSENVDNQLEVSLKTGGN